MESFDLRWAASLAACVFVAGCGGDGGFQVATPSSDDADANEASLGIDAPSETESDSAPHRDTGVDTNEGSDSGREAGDSGGDAHGEVLGDAIGDVAIDAPCDAPVFCYPDADGDGYAAATGAFAACGACPSKSLVVDPTTAKLDCNDLDGSVHPGAPDYHGTAYCVPGTGCSTKSFDYDCDGVESLEWTAIGTTCAVAGSGCAGDGWASLKAPACGVSGTWENCTRMLLSCSASSVSRTQACR